MVLRRLECEIDGASRVHVCAVEGRHIRVARSNQQADLCATEHDGVSAALDQIADHGAVRGA
jgi:hypothetical protein